MRNRVNRAVSQSPMGTDGRNSTETTRPSRSSIPLVHIGLFGLCIYTGQERPGDTVTCVTHAQLDYEWLPHAWQVNQFTLIRFNVDCCVVVYLTFCLVSWLWFESSFFLM